jgi:hypothetical protein
MIGTIRKHSKWLWILIATLTIVSFVVFFSPNQRLNGNAGGNVDFGSIYGQKITQDDYQSAKREFYLFYLFHYGNWPDKAGLAQLDIDREIYLRLMFIKKAELIGIHVSDEAAAMVANEMLRSLGHGQNVTMDSFSAQILQPQGLSVADFENFARHDVTIQQLVQALGLSGSLITPQEAADVYARENQERSAQIIFFPASKYLSEVQTTPAALAQFYTNYLAEYRLPDRVQVSYVAFELSSFLAQSQAEWAKTNLDDEINSLYLSEGTKDFPDAKTPDEAKQKIREILIQRRALADARTQANDFATAVFNIDPPKPENLTVVAKKMGLTVKLTEPFDSQSGPPGISAPEDFAKAAFSLTADQPFAGPLVNTNVIYVMVLETNLPSAIPAFADIKDRVTQDFEMQQAVALARQDGTNTAIKLMVGMTAGKNFASACAAAKVSPQTLPAFSLSTRELPGISDRMDLNQFLQFAATVPVGHLSQFVGTSDGGFLLYVQSQLPVDAATMSANLPAFTGELRRARENEAFQVWLNTEASRELKDTLFARESASARQP